MICGIGVDTACIAEIERLCELDSCGQTFFERTFTSEERSACEKRSDKSEYLATRFAAKEAVFKAIAHLTPEKTFNLRIVETLNEDDGCPYVNVTPALHIILGKAGVNALQISLTTEGGFATAFIVAVSDAL